MFPTLQIGPLSFPTVGLVYILGAYVALSLNERAARWLKQDAARLYNLSGLLLLAYFVGARLTFVAIYWPVFRQDLLSIVWPLNSGYNLWGGLVIMLATGIFYGRFHQLKPWPTLDVLAPGLLLMLMVISLADFLGGPGFGKLTNMPWGITQFGVRRHPVQIYEVLVALLALAGWWYLHRHRLFDGQLFLLSVAFYSGGRLFIDAYRENAWLADNGIHLLQVVCLVLMLVSLYLLGQRGRQTVSSN